MAEKAVKVRKDVQEGVGYSLVDLDSVKHALVSVTPSAGGGLREQTQYALTKIDSVLDALGGTATVIKQNVYLRRQSAQSICHRILTTHYTDGFPVTNYVAQPPCRGRQIAVEAWAVLPGRDELSVTSHSEHMLELAYDGMTWAHVAGVISSTRAEGVHRGCLRGFRTMKKLLRQKGYSFEQVVRTWLYLSDIVGTEGENERYRELNSARTNFYRNIRFGRKLRRKDAKGRIYPGSTGIGMLGEHVAMSCIALEKSHDGVFIRSVENPHQISAFKYGRQYGRASPKFSRAMTVVTGNYATIFISGTASILDCDSVHEGDVVKQTHQTIENIVNLIAEANFRQHNLAGFGATPRDVAQVTAYVKRSRDYRKVRRICEERFGNAPAVYVVADVCRPELLVEIEGMAFTKRKR